ncbi:MAG: UDP-N-acetylmuramoyl-L-alanine--D-glutamate ligase [Bacteroidales bacterium]
MRNRVAILGAGESGTGAAVLAAKMGLDVFVSDMSAIKPKYRKILEDNNIEFEELQHSRDLILNSQEVIKSPGIPDKAPIVKEIIELGIPILSEIEFAARYTNAKMICITGSNGKTTTTMLIHHMLVEAGLEVGLAGNVGNSLALQVAKGECDYYVVELSSFQLDNMYSFKADIAILLNITPDHLDRYEYKMENYVASKFRITQNQTDVDHFLYWSDDPIVNQEVKKRNINAITHPFALNRSELSAAFIEDGIFYVRVENELFEMPTKNLALSGTHNLYNSMAAGIVGKIIGLKNQQIKTSLSNFKGVEHRLERAGIVNGVTYINDSKATNVNSCYYALQSMSTPTVLILGGIDKGNDYSEIEELVKEHVHSLIFMGNDNSKLHLFFDRMGINSYDASSMAEALEISKSVAKSGDTVLLSPCCASFDLFENYEDRGRQFKSIVSQL